MVRFLFANRYENITKVARLKKYLFKIEKIL